MEKVKQLLICMLLTLALFSLSACTSAEKSNEISGKERREMTLSIDGRIMHVIWEDNETVQALKTALEKEQIRVRATRYGGFEQVRRLAQSFTRNDVEMTSSPGDIVLYSGNQIVIFFGSNSWSYTKLGQLKDISQEELRALLDRDSVEILIQYRQVIL